MPVRLVKLKDDGLYKVPMRKVFRPSYNVISESLGESRINGELEKNEIYYPSSFKVILKI